MLKVLFVLPLVALVVNGCTKETFIVQNKFKMDERVKLCNESEMYEVIGMIYYDLPYQRNIENQIYSGWVYQLKHTGNGAIVNHIEKEVCPINFTSNYRYDSSI